MDAHRIKELLARYNQGTCTQEEKALVESWYLDRVDREDIPVLDEQGVDEAQRSIWEEITAARPAIRPRRKRYRQFAAVASVVLLCGLSFYFISQRSSSPDHVTAVTEDVVVKPGGNNAYLTLADGQRIDLTHIDDGMLSQEAGVRIYKAADGELLYEALDEYLIDAASLGNNTIETPTGGQYQIRLPDGTKVWLNSSSSLEYPVRFAKHERRVQLKGEAYFEVQSDKDKPFYVNSPNQTVEVLGTKFNVNSYDDEPSMKTTLLEGSVRVSTGSSSQVLKPGEQATIINHSITINTVDIDQVIGWSRGDFVFHGVELKNIMRQISRWYGVEVVYESAIGDVKFGGSISRSKNIEEVLKVLSMTQGVNFKLEGRRVMVMQ